MTSGITPSTLVVTAVHTETRAVLDVLRRVRRIEVPGFRSWEGETPSGPLQVVQSGIGPERARRALTAMPASPALVLCVGFAGGLADGQPGDIVLPTHVVWHDAVGSGRYEVPRDTWATAERALAGARLGRILHGPLFSSATVLASPYDKRATHERTGAVAVEMETAGLISIANAHGAAILPVRVILDAADVSLERLPPDLDGSWRARIQLIGRPHAWSSVWALARHVPTATARLREALRVVFAALPVKSSSE
jgi:nucleoside phosphorylase